MQTHRQSSIRYIHDEKRDLLLPVQRTRHIAYELGAPCSRCGLPICAEGGRQLPTLVVHIERAEAAWSS